MKRTDPYQQPDEQDQKVIEAMAKRLEERGEHEDFQGFIDDYVEKIVSLSDIKTVLDLGCGTGVVTRRLRAALPRDVTVIGSDISAKLLEKARQIPSEGIRWEHGTEGTLDYEDASVDVLVLHTVMSHLKAPVLFLQEVRRVMKPRGLCVVFDADYASTTYGVRDFQKGREIDTTLLGAVVHNLDICRRMPRLVQEAGLVIEDHQSYVISEAGKGDFWLSSVRGFQALIPALEILPQAEGEAWVKEMLENHERGTFFASGNYYTYTLRR